jgi:hypothetical protein
MLAVIQNHLETQNTGRVMVMLYVCTVSYVRCCVPKHVEVLLTPDMYIFWLLQIWFYKLIRLHVSAEVY